MYDDVGSLRTAAAGVGAAALPLTGTNALLIAAVGLGILFAGVMLLRLRGRGEAVLTKDE